MKKSLLFAIAILATSLAFSQSKTDKQKLKNPTSTPRSMENITITPYPSTVPSAARTMFNGSPIKFNPQPIVSKRANGGLKVQLNDADGSVIAIQGKLEDVGLKTGSIEMQGMHYLETAAPLLKIKNPSAEFELKTTDTDKLGMTHLRYEQRFEGLKIYNAEILLHAKDAEIFMLNGRSAPTPQIESTTPQLTENQALATVETHLTEVKKEHYEKGFDTKYLGTDQIKTELIIYFLNKKNNDARLAYHVTIHPNLMKRFEYFVDANTGEILHHYGAFCQFAKEGLTKKTGHSCSDHSDAISTPNHQTIKQSNHQLPPGPEEANATDLNGQTRRIQTYLHNGTYFMIDAAKPMHNTAASSFPNDASGVIWTIDGQGGTPARPNSFNAIHVTSGNNSWNDRRAVSAHYNAEQAYLYFLNVHNRNSINNKDGNIMSFVNIAEDDGSQMDNAFWNGSGIFYGNGNQAFTSSLAKSLDVAGHEMAHGVIQTTANLEYQGESGALNESFADIFAAMIDRDDWKIGEDIVNPQFFPTGAMRDMANPNNGAPRNSQNWQPAHYNERFTGREDNGGVHINSGIPNHAFYLFANSAGVGRERAEKVFYRALDKYLVRSSQFVDLRAATLQSVDDLNYGATVRNAMAKALNDVGIPGGSSNDYQDDFDENPGEGFLIMTNLDESAVFLANSDGDLVGNPFFEEDLISKVSMTDDGSFGYFIGADKTMYRINFVAGSYAQVEATPQWVNIAVSKDGSKLAALTDDNDNSIWIFDFNTQMSQTFFLYNPTFTAGVATGDVVFPDVIEWDYSGEWVMYDALNRLPTNFGEIEYWDIGFLNAWDNSASTFGEGIVQKLYSVTPDNTDIGNPTFAKNSPYIIAFDIRDNNLSVERHDLMTGNLQTGDESPQPLASSSTWNFPNFDIEDKSITFNARTTDGDDVIARLPISDDKLEPTGNATIFVSGGNKGVWFGNGQRVTTSAESVDFQEVISFFPNPASDELTIEIDLPESGDLQVELYDLAGKRLSTQTMNFGQNSVDVSVLPEGSYFISVRNEEQILKTERIVVLR